MGQPACARERIRSIGARFRIDGELVSAEPLGSGHIHETFVAAYAAAAGPARYVHQRLNTRIFTDPLALCENAVRITEHLRRKLSELMIPDRERRCLSVVETREGFVLHVDADGGCWRTFRYVEGTRTRDAVESPEQAYRAARAFGAFARMLADLEGPALAVTIPDFHDLPKRFAALGEAIRADSHRRVESVAAEIDTASRLYECVDRVLAEHGGPALPRRVVHNDCKLNNVLFDEVSDEALCVIDLDTVMDGTVLCDFGELVRSGTCRAPEDALDLESMSFDRELFSALARGYLSGAGAFLTPLERGILPLAGVVLTLENAIRFLTDHLSGDVYFRVHRDGHNLDRCRAQMRLAELMIEGLDEARRIVENAPSG